jgi:hypothetical protein
MRWERTNTQEFSKTLVYRCFGYSALVSSQMPVLYTSLYLVDDALRDTGYGRPFYPLE